MNEPGCFRVIRTPPGRITETIYQGDFLQQFDNKQTDNSMSFSLPANPGPMPERRGRHGILTFIEGSTNSSKGSVLLTGNAPQAGA
ncbi:MAG: hypothetical protein AB7D51_11355, partial [Desulfovibrionaceae bacterium]